MFTCPNCGNADTTNAFLVDDRIQEMKNGDKIIAPRCQFCLKRLPVDNTWNSNDKKQKVILITGLCGSGKSTIGKKLEEKTGYIHIDGDAVSKRVNWDIRNGYLVSRSGYRVFDELLDTIQVVLQQGFSVIATYVFTEEVMKKYEAKLVNLAVDSHFFVLKTDPAVCIQRDKMRDCWTAGEEFVMKWYEEQEVLANSLKWAVIDNSFESLDETVQRIMMQI